MCKLSKEPRIRNILLIGLLCFSMASCENNTFENAPLNGTWIEVNQKSDTLVFDNLHTAFDLNRGTEIRNGNLLPKYLSGPYFYKLGKDSIMLRWILSSSSYGNNYYFKVDSKNEQIKFGNFFVDSLNKNEILIFSKIH